MANQTTTIPKGWKMTTLGEVADIIMGQSPSGESYNQKHDGLPFYQGITEFGDKYVDIKTFTNAPTKIIEANSILFSVRAPVGKVNFTKHKACIGRGNAGLKMKNGQQNFLYFLLKKSEKAFLSNTTGTVFDSISGGQLREFEVLIPEREEEQRAIAAVLSSLDDKIELLREQNKTLEATAQAIFKEWFVNFNFPNEEGKPYKASGGKMIDSELGEIPEGWRVGKLTEVFDFMEGPGIRNWQYTDTGRKFINIRLIQNGDIDIASANHISFEEAETTYKHFHLQEKDMVISTSGTLGRSAVVRKEHLPLMLNTSVIRFRPIDGLSYGFMYQFLNSPFFQNELESMASGSVQLNFGPVHLKQIVLIIPSKEILGKFALAVNSLYEKKVVSLSQIETLSALRDSLLPKLTKGDVRVKEFKD